MPESLLAKSKKLLQSQTKLLVKNSSWVFAGNFFRTFLVFLKGVVMVRFLGTELFGLYAIIINFVGIIQEFLNLNLGTTIIKFGASYKSDKKTPLLVALIKTGVLASFVSVLVSILIIVLILIYFYDVFLEEKGLEWYIITYAFAAGTLFFDNISQGILRLYYKFKALSALAVIVTSLEFIIVVTALYFESTKLSTLFIALIASKLLGSIIYGFGTAMEVKDDLKKHLGSSIFNLRADWKKIGEFTLANSGSRSIHTASNKGDVMLLAALGGANGPVWVTYYSLAKKLAYAVLTIVDPLVQSIFPQFSILISEKKYREMRKMIRQITKMALVPASIFLVAVYFVKDWLITVIYGADRIGAAEPFTYHMIGAALGTVFFWNLSLIISIGMVRFRLVVSAIGTIIGAAVACYLIPTWGASGAALGLLVANFLIIISFSLASYFTIGKFARLEERNPEISPG